MDSYGKNSVGQVIQQNHCIWKYAPESLALIDLDEYLNWTPQWGVPIISFPNYWFGCANKTGYTYDNFIYNLTKRAKNGNIYDHRKCIINSNYVDLFCVHVPIKYNCIIKYLSYSTGYLRHYYCISQKNRLCKCTEMCIVNDPCLFLKFDIVIMLGPNDKTNIYKHINAIKNNVIGYNKIYVVSYDPYITIDDCITIDERIFPFTVEDMININPNRRGWYLQQLLKLYAGFVIHGLLNRYLVIDADVFFMKPTTFIDDDGKSLLCTGDEYNDPYFVHMNKMHPSLKKMLPLQSGISHHMMFETQCVKSLFELVETTHTAPFWKTFIKHIDCNNHSGSSEYEMYFNYMLAYHPDKIKIRQLKWCNVDTLDVNNNVYDYVAHHYYMSTCKYVCRYKCETVMIKTNQCQLNHICKHKQRNRHDCKEKYNRFVGCIIGGSGLGNQLFQVFTVLALSIDNGYSAYFTQTKYFNNIFHKLIHKEFKEFKKCTVVKELREGIYNKLDIHGNSIIDGYFQSIRYFNKYSNEIIKFLNFPIPSVTVKYDISLHIRRGDYLLGNCYVILSYDYYINSINYICAHSIIKQPHILIVSENTQDCTEYIKHFKTKISHICTIDVIDHSIQDWEQMLVMSTCNHNIIANSTFSWWSAYINTNPNKIVCYPSQWYNNKVIPTLELFPESWIQIEI